MRLNRTQAVNVAYWYHLADALAANLPEPQVRAIEENVAWNIAEELNRGPDAACQCGYHDRALTCPHPNGV